MRRLRLPACLAAALALALTLAVAPGAGARAAHHRHRACPKGGHTLARSRSARVWVVGDPSGDDEADYYGCLRSNGRVRSLDATTGCLHECDTVADVRLAGRYVTWERTSTFSYGPGAPSSDGAAVTVYDLARGGPVAQATLYDEQSDGSTPLTPPPGALAALLLDARGTAVVLFGAPGALALSALPAGASATVPLDPGPVDAGSLSLSGSTLTWTDAGQPRSATLPDGAQR